MIRIGKTDADFQELYQTQHQRVRRMLQGMTGNASVAEELMQESFLKAWNGLAYFGFKSSLKTWVYQVAINTGRDWLRSHKNHQPLDGMDFPDESSGAPEKKAIQESLMDLKDDVREILILNYFEEMDQKEIAAVLEIPVGTVKSRLHSAKGQLKEALMRRGYDV